MPGTEEDGGFLTKISVKLLSAGGDVNIGVVILRDLSLSKMESTPSDRSETTVISSSGLFKDAK